MNATFEPAVEANFDGLVGPTHNYAGLSAGNLASTRNVDSVSNPRDAARQGLHKMQVLMALGLPQGVLPPQERPHLPSLRARGFRGRDADVLWRIRHEAPQLLAQVSSASSMWAANAATVSPAADTGDGRVHFTPANLVSNPHRAMECAGTARLLAATFAETRHFRHHPALAAREDMADEGAANQMRLCLAHGAPGLSVFVYGREVDATDLPEAFPARQALAASQALAAQHGLRAGSTLFLQQHPEAIDAGAFHNDVVALSNERLLIYHARAYADASALKVAAQRVLGPENPAKLIAVSEAELSLEEAIACYLFNSQLVSLPAGGMQLICARECAELPRAWSLVQGWISDPTNPIRAAQVVDLRQSMRNGGGPACLRLRVVLTPAQQAAVNPRSWITPPRLAELLAVVERHYRDRLQPTDLADPQLLDESRTALDAFSRILGLGSVYDFQR